MCDRVDSPSLAGAGPRLEVRRTLALQGVLGLHARRAAAIAATAAGFAAEVTVALNGRQASAKSVLSLLTLGAAAGAELQVTAAGRDAQQAMHAVERLLASDPDDPRGKHLTAIPQCRLAGGA